MIIDHEIATDSQPYSLVSLVYGRLEAFLLGQDLQNRASFWVTRASPGDSFQ